ncbi:hypothetical protein NBRC110019_02680 [Neptunitalea chrysea]|uniref:Outer membrane protein TolC n=2 Tax=Neptunitalea chrysea TaxID=1647581 RepID=A0A9W6ETL5_9FLAO|nr:hypothetical protein NBRC110019_02680 [Neptunitalea chrysea]
MTFSQSLDSLIKIAIDNNPEIQQLQLQYEISNEKINEVGSLSNTEFGVGYFVSEPETRTGPQTFKLSVKQMFPWFGTLTARENYQNSLADVEFENLSIAKRKLALSVAKSYYKLNAIYGKQVITDKNITLLQTYEELALNAVEIDKASLVDVLKIKMRQNELIGEIQVLVENYKGELATLQQLLNTSDTITLRDYKVLSIPSDIVLNETTDSLQLHPELIKYDKLYKSVSQSEVVNQKGKNPIIGVGLDYINVAERTDMYVTDNGKDIVMPMVTLSIPVFNKSYKSKSKQHQLAQEKLLAAKQERYNQLVAVLKQNIANRNAAKIKFETQTKNIDQADKTEKILMKSYETNTLKFNDLIDVQELKLKFQLMQIDAALSYYLQTINIHYLSNNA